MPPVSLPRPGLTEEASGGYHDGMKSVGLKVLKDRLSEFVRLAAGGETILVTDRDQVVAELVPPRKGRNPFLGDLLMAEAVRKGWVVPPEVVCTEPPLGIPVAKLGVLLAELDQDRDDR
jgi:antitoxin (DNA-binding transcriptional repressor) of toxin-antitoxin stability system